MYIGLLKCLVRCCLCQEAMMSSVSSKTLQTSRRSSGFSVQQEAPAGSAGCGFHTGPEFSLSYFLYQREKSLLGSAAQKAGGNPPPKPLLFQSLSILTHLLGCFFGHCLFSYLPLSMATLVGTSLVLCSGLANMQDSRTSGADLHAEVYQPPLYP